MKAIILSACILMSCKVFSQTSTEGTTGMKTYYMVFLKKGPTLIQDSITAENIQKGHIEYLNKMYAEGFADLAGPLTDDGDIRGIVVYKTETLEEAKRLAEEDPAVKSGRLAVEVHPWYSMKGFCLR